MPDKGTYIMKKGIHNIVNKVTCERDMILKGEIIAVFLDERKYIKWAVTEKPT
jgi:hypothetical protein